MKKIMILALAMMASASFNQAIAGGKKDKKEKKANNAVVAPVAPQLITEGDSLSYAAGMNLTGGLMPYLKQQYGLDESRMDDVARGFSEAIAQRNDSAFYAYATGMQIASMVQNRMLDNLKNDLGEVNEDLVFSGFLAAMKKDYSLFTDSAAQKTFTDGRAKAVERKNQQVKAEGEAFLAENKTKEGVVTLPSGLQYKVLKAGNGAVPKATDKVKVVYEGRTLDGNVFDATSKHGKDSDTFGVNGLIKGWTEALLLMPVGSKWELYIPQELAYGERGAGRNIAPYSALIFTLELLGIE